QARRVYITSSAPAGAALVVRDAGARGSRHPYRFSGAGHRASARCVRQALDLAADELGPGQLAFDPLSLIHAQAAGEAFDAAVRQGLELTQARGQSVGVDAHGIQAPQAAAGLWPLGGDLFAQWV